MTCAVHLVCEFCSFLRCPSGLSQTRREFREVLGFLSAQFLCLGFTSSVWIAFRLLRTSVTRSSLVSFSVSVRAPVYL